ncbi:MAG TPA: N,N-dimethylformamidase beta subunit family domain-containing protein, partial [Thermoanaerobaculia bacterium]|nr:N,N-dimethylformamidase beta subunit family domain-containing protein [Thermoanaerobaculia bacterium]
MQPFTNCARQIARGLSLSVVGIFTLFLSTTPAAANCLAPANEIVAENCLPGNAQSEWDIIGAGDPTIQGFATDMSYDQGQTVEFKVKTDAPDYRIDIYRLGWYGGAGARKVETLLNSVTPPRAAQPACLDDEPATLTTHIVDCGNWTVTDSWAIPSTAVSGIYIGRLVRLDTLGASHIVFIVRDDDGASDLLYQTSDTTWQAYNQYGGYSLYERAGGVPRAYKVSYNRPFVTAETNPESWLFGPEYPMVRWMERNGYDVSYTTGVDTHRSPGELLDHKVFLSVGHDEYWSAEQRANVAAARDAGLNLAFLTGNDVFWKTRWENNFTGVAPDGSNTFGLIEHRTLVCYKETTAGFKIDPTPVWTGTWRDSRFGPHDGGRPENELTGTLFMVNRGGTTSMDVSPDDGKLRFWRHTNVGTLGANFPFGYLGYEWNEDVDNGLRPAGQIRMSQTVRSDVPYARDFGNTYTPGTATHRLTLHRRPSGALVFSAGTVQWTWGLDAMHHRGVIAQELVPPPDGRIQQATINLLADMGAQPGSIEPGFVASPASADVTAPASTITFPAAGATLPAGKQITITGTATDAGGGVVGGVEVSVDGGATWHPAVGRTSWSYKWTPSIQGPATIRSRASDDSAHMEAPASGVTVTIGPAAPIVCPCSIWSPLEPAGPQSDDSASINVGVKFRSDIDGYITAIRFYKHIGNSGPHTAYLWTAPTTGTGTLLRSATFTAETASGWQEVPLTPPLAITAGSTYVAAYHTPSGRYAASRSYFETAGVDNPPLHALAENVHGSNGVFAYGLAGTYPSRTFGYSNYWVDVVFDTTIADSTPPAISLTAPAPAAVGANVENDITATFNEAMDAASINGLTFELRGPGTTLIPATVTFAAATRTASLNPSGVLDFLTSYTATVKGGPTGVRDLAGNPLAADYSWTFTTAADIGCPCTLWPGSATPSTVSTDPNPVNLGVKFQAEVNGYIKAIRFYRPAGNTATVTGYLYSATGAPLASAAFPAASSAGWQEATLATPFPVNANTTYVAAYHSTGGSFSVSRPYFASQYTRPPLRALANGASGPNGSYRYGAPAFPSDNPGDGPNYWVDVVFDTTVADHTAPLISGRTPASGATLVPLTPSVTVTFNEAMDAASITAGTFELRDSSSNVIAAQTSYDVGSFTATLVPSAPLAYTATYTVTVRGGVSGVKDIAGNELATDHSWTFTTIPPTPSFTVPPSVSVFEDGGGYEQQGAASVESGHPDGTGVVTFTLTTDQPELFSQLPAMSPSGVLTFTTAADAFGTATVTVIATNEDGGSSAPQSFTISIAAVNDAPSFTAGPALTVAEDSGAHSGAWATAISAGPANENSQILTFLASNNASELFAVQPAITAGGTLTFTPAADANGSATVTVRLQDDGATDGGGADTSPEQTFTITITPVNDVPRFMPAGDVTVVEDSGSYSAVWA